MRVLMICHNHPALHPGGTEIFAYDLFGELKRRQGVEAMFLACTDSLHREQKPGTSFQAPGRSADEIILWAGHFDRFFQSQVDLHGVVPDLEQLLRDFRPDVVHLHHVLLLGAEMLFLIRSRLPQARIVLTLHDYHSICANDGQMVTTGAHRLCRAASPSSCHACFPRIPADRFLLREKHLKAMLSQVDRFAAPSRFLKDRYVAWGLPAGRIDVVPNGLPEAAPAPEPGPGPRTRFAYFGNLSPYKGTPVLLAAARRLAEAGCDFSLTLHGGMPFQSEAFTAEVARGIEAARGRVVHAGAYDRGDVGALMAGADWVVVPSIWWENAPLVIGEAFQHRRPVICSGIGGMAEMVRDGVDGLHAPAGDAVGLAAAMGRAASEPGLWERLAGAIRRVPTIADCAGAYVRLYAPARRKTARAAHVLPLDAAGAEAAGATP